MRVAQNSDTLFFLVAVFVNGNSHVEPVFLHTASTNANSYHHYYNNDEYNNENSTSSDALDLYSVEVISVADSYSKILHH